MPIGHLQFLIQGEKTHLPTLGRSHTCVPLPPAALRGSAASVVLARVSASPAHTVHTRVPGWLHSRRQHWPAPLVRSAERAGDSSAHRPPTQSPLASLADGLFSTARQRQRLPLLALSSAAASLRASSWTPSVLDFWDDSFPLRQCTTP